MKLQLINDINTLKSTDNATQIELAVVDEQQQFIDLSQFKMIIVNIGINEMLYSSETPTINTDTNTFNFVLSQSLPVGSYQIQVHLTKQDDTLHIAPNQGSQSLKIEKSFNELGETVTILSVQKLLDDMATTLEIAKAADAKSDDAVVKVDDAVQIANEAKELAADANTNASESLSTANEAKNIADTAKATADEAKMTADDADTKSVTALDTANDALELSKSANTKSDGAVSTADDANEIARLVREEFDSLTAGNTDAELIAARTDEANTTHESLKKRIDSEATKRNAGDAETLRSAKDYADAKTDDTAVNNHLVDFMPHDSELSQYASAVDENGVYTVVTFKRTDDTVYMISTANNADANGNYQKFTWEFYDTAGTNVVLIKTWSITYDADGVATSKEVA